MNKFEKAMRVGSVLAASAAVFLGSVALTINSEADSANGPEQTARATDLKSSAEGIGLLALAEL